MLDVRRVRVPGIELAFRRHQIRPVSTTLLDPAVHLLEHRRDDVLLLDRLDLGAGWPDVMQVHLLAVDRETLTKTFYAMRMLVCLYWYGFDGF